MPVETKYIISCTTSLFSEDVIQNMFILATHPDDFTFEDGLNFLSLLKEMIIFQELSKIWENSFGVHLIAYIF